MRGDLKVKNDTDLTADDVADHNLVLFGDPGSNRQIARVLKDLPTLTWTRSELKLGGASYTPADHVPVLIAPNSSKNRPVIRAARAAPARLQLSSGACIRASSSLDPRLVAGRFPGAQTSYSGSVPGADKRWTAVVPRTASDARIAAPMIGSSADVHQAG